MHRCYYYNVYEEKIKQSSVIKLVWKISSFYSSEVGEAIVKLAHGLSQTKDVPEAIFHNGLASFGEKIIKMFFYTQ